MASLPSSFERLALSGCPMLDSTNSGIWQERITDVLKGQQLWKYANGSSTRPTVDNTEADATKKEAQQEKLIKWQDEDDKASATLRRFMSDVELAHVRGASSCKEVWDRICAAHSTEQHLSGLISHMAEIINMRLPEGADRSATEQHIYKMRQLNQRLKDSGRDMDFKEGTMAGILSNSFPASYDPIKMSLGQLDHKAYTFKAVERAMLEELSRRSLSAASTSPQPSESSAMYTHTAAPRGEKKEKLSKSNNKKNEKRTNSTSFCTHCGRDNHTVDRCREKQRAQQRVEERSSGASANAAIAEEDSYFVSLGNQAPKQVTSVLQWVVDSAASQHFCNQRQLFANFKPVSGRRVRLGDGHTLPIKGRGDIRATVPLPGNKSTVRIFTNVQFVPDLAVNLLSVATLTDEGFSAYFSGDACTIRDSTDHIVGRAQKIAHRLYYLTVTPSTTASVTDGWVNITQGTGSLPAAALRLWHQRLGHLNEAAVQQLFSKRMIADIEEQLRRVRKRWRRDRQSTPPSPPCEACALGKSHRQPHSTAPGTRASAPLELVHTDVCGPFRVRGTGGALYFMTVVDDHSRLIWIRFLTDRKDIFLQFRAFRAWAENVHSAAGHRVKRVRMDGGGEYASHAFTRWLDQQGIEVERTPPYTSSQNGVAERVNRTLADLMRSMMVSAQLPHQYWVEAIQAAVLIRNRSPTHAVPDMTPYEAFYGKRPTLDRLRAYGCLAYVHIPTERQQGKLAPRATPCMLIGYTPDSTAYLFLDVARSVLVRSQDATFDESCIGLTAIVARGGHNTSIAPLPYVPMPFPFIDEAEDATPAINLRGNPAAPEASPSPSAHINQPPPSDLEEEDDLPVLVAPPAVVDEPPAMIAPPLELQVNNAPAAPVLSPAPPPASAAPAPTTAPSNVSASTASGAVKVPRELRRLQDTLASGSKDHAPSTVTVPRADAMVSIDSHSMSGSSKNDPLTVREALQCPEADEWKSAVRAELDSMHAADVWDLVELPKGKTAIGSKFVFRTKYNAQGNVVRRKARLVAQGFTQQYGVDYFETYAPVARFASIRAILAMVAHHDWELDQMDVKSAYLNGVLQEEVYMKQPPQFAEPGKEHLVCKLKKSIYGLKQAGRVWNHRIDAVLKKLGFSALYNDTCVYVYRRGDLIVISSLYVDDLLLASNSRAQLDGFKKELASHFDMEDLGEAHFVLGIEIQRDRKARTLHISQGAYIKDVLARFGMDQCTAMAIPMEKGLRLLKATDGDPLALDAQATRDYQARVGALIYAMQATRPDIAYAVTALSQFCSKPTTQHQQAVKRVFRYLRGTVDHGITYRGSGSRESTPTLLGYCDSDWAEDVNDRKSITGYAFLLGNAAISWKSKKQPTQALSSVEAEYMAACEAAKEALWWRSFLKGIGYQLTAPTRVLSDNQGSIALSKNPGHHDRTKHIDLRHHFVRDRVADGTMVLEHVGTGDMAADVLTKALVREKHNHATTLLGVAGAPLSSSSGKT